MDETIGNINRIIDGYEREMVEELKNIIGIKSISPSSGGMGESKRVEHLLPLLKAQGADAKIYSYKDETGTERPSIVATRGAAGRTIWVVAHIDTVSEGDPAMWSTNPFEGVEKDGRVYGRGSSDNGQDVVAGIYAMKALGAAKAEMKYRMGLVLVADEEVGSKYGIQKLLDEQGVFGKDDMFLVPDAGVEDGSEIEVSEKGMLWIKITTTGKQVHASTPHLGINACRHAVGLLDRIDTDLHRKYTKTNKLFAPDTSTFEITKREANVGSVNIIPGKDVSYIDCRILPDYSVDEVLEDVKRLASEAEMRTPGLKIEVEVFQREDPAPTTDPNSEIARLLGKRIREQLGVEPKTIGIGGGTCAAFARRKGFQAAVWNTTGEVAHSPDEYAVIKHMMGDAKVIASLFV